MHPRRFLGMVLRLGILAALATIAFGQVRQQPAYVWIETTAAGDLRGTLTIPLATAPAGLPATFARAIGCDVADLKKLSYESRIVVECPAHRTSALTLHAAVGLAELTPLLREAGLPGIDFVLTTPHFSWLRLDPAIAPQPGSSGAYYRTHYSLDEAPQQITIDGGFDIRQLKALAACAAGFILAPLLLLLLRPSDPLRLRVQMEAILVLAWIGWIWALLRADAGTLLSFLFGHGPMGPLLALMVPPLIAAWVGSRVAAMQFVRLAPDGIDNVDHYRRTRFWTGAAVACFLSMMLNLLLSTSSDPFGSLLVGSVLTLVCVICLRRVGRGGSRPLAEGDLRRRIFELAARAGVKLRNVSILTSSNQPGPVAFGASWGVIFFNEGLLRHLSRREVDAVVCHELSHVRPGKRSLRVVIWMLLVVLIVATKLVPHFTLNFVPLILLAIYFLFKFWRRKAEYQADLDSVRWSGYPEAMITGLARVSYAHGMPLEWHPPISWMMAHPATMDRFRAIARAGSLSDARIAELIEESRHEPADHYEEAAAALVGEDAAFSPTLRQRMRTRLNVFVALAPIGFGLPAAWLLERSGLPWWTVIAAGSLLTILGIYLGYEWIAGSVRATVKQRALARHGAGLFVGFSPAAEPRVFDGMYHYDLGMLRFVDQGLEFVGDRTHFTLDRRQVRRVWLGKGARHWTPRKVVYVECQPSTESAVVVFSLQSLEARFWPSTVRMARRLHRRIAEWYQSPAASTAPPLPCPILRVEGGPPTSFTVRSALRTVGVYCVVALFLSFGKNWIDPSGGLPDVSQTFSPVAVCGLAALFLVWPNLRRGRPAPPISGSNGTPADDKAPLKAEATSSSS